MKTLVMLLAGCALLKAQQVNDGEKLIQASDCSSCHAIERQVVGPAYSAIAQRYAGQGDAVDKLAARIRDGVGGMPAHPALSDSQRKAIAEWILSQKGTGNAQGPAKQYSHALKDGTT